MTGDMPRNPVDKGLYCQPRPLVAVMPGFLQRAQIGGDTGDPQQPGLFVDHALQILERLAGLPGNPRHRAKIHVSAARAHHQSFKRRHPHGRVHAYAVTHRADGRPVAEMGDHQAAVIGREPESACACADT